MKQQKKKTMLRLKDLIDSYLSPRIGSQSYNEKLRHSVKANDKEWEHRAMLSSKSFLTAICFKIASESMLNDKVNFVFPPIGLYYSVFHLSVSMLHLEHTTSIVQLQKIHHNTLLKLVKSKLIQTKLVKADYEKWYNELRALREFCNYKFGYEEDIENLTKDVNRKTDKAFDEGVKYIRQILNTTDKLFRFQVGIGDGFGDDILDTYIAKEDKEIVWSELVRFGLTV